MENVKTCKNCEIEHDTQNFYSHPTGANGLSNICKSCYKNKSKAIYDKKMSNGRYLKTAFLVVEKEARIEGGKSKTELKRQYKKRYPEKAKAGRAVLGIKVEKGLQKHHWSYNDEHFLDVLILTTKQHGFIHRHIIYDQTYKKYRTLQGELLSTREEHISYISAYM